MADLDELKAQVADLHQQLNRLKCSFCGKIQDQVQKIISGPGVYICNECVSLCNDVLDEDPPQDDRLVVTKRELLRVVLETDKWMARRVADKSVGVQVLVADNPLGANLEEQVLNASALEALVKDGLLVQCSNEGNETIYQLTWKGLLQARP